MRRAKIAVIVINLLLVCIVGIITYQGYATEIALAHRLGNAKAGLSSYVHTHFQELGVRAIVIAILFLGIYLEKRRADLAIFVNTGLPFCVFAIVAVDCAISWHENPQEVEVSFTLVCLPLLALVLTYLILYRADLRTLLGKVSHVEKS